MAESILAKSTQGYGYKYTDIAQIHTYLESKNIKYYQYIETVEGHDYIMTVPIIGDKEQPARRGCRVVNAPLSGKSNPAQEQGSAITYARRYSLLMAFGLATDDDDAASLTKKPLSKSELITAIIELAKDKNIPIANVYGRYKKDKLEDMTIAQLENAKGSLEKS